MIPHGLRDIRELVIPDVLANNIELVIPYRPADIRQLVVLDGLTDNTELVIPDGPADITELAIPGGQTIILNMCNHMDYLTLYNL